MPQSRNRPVDGTGAEALHKVKEGVQRDNPAKLIRYDGDGIKQGGKIGDRRQSHPVDIVDIPEENHQSRKHQPHPHGKDEGQKSRNDGINHTQVEGRLRDRHHQQQGNKGKGKIDQPGDRPGCREDVLGDADLFHQGCVADHRAHRHIGYLAEHIENDLPAEEVDREVLDLKAEDIRKYDGDDQHGQQRVQNRPKHSENRTLVFRQEIPAH